jgi:hypothetical protein
LPVVVVANGKTGIWVDVQWSCNEPMVELLLRSISAELSWNHDNLEGSVCCDLEASYHNMEKAGLKT